jgi:hypothetical protein
MEKKAMSEFSIPARTVLANAHAKELTSVIIIGRDDQGALFVAANGDPEEHLRDIQSFLMAMDAGEYDVEDGE